MIHLHQHHEEGHIRLVVLTLTREQEVVEIKKKINDGNVTEVSVDQVQGVQPYILFYERD